LNTSSAQLASNALKEELLKAELPGPKPNPPQVQQWIVLATWEQVETPGRAVPLSSDYESDQSADQPASDTVGQPNAQTPTQNSGQSTTQITVTRLIFRVIPLNSKLNQPAPLPVRAGWLVFQL
jgi:hypothetical protein